MAVDVKENELVQLLHREIEHIYNLMNLLEQESAALGEHHPTALEEVVTSKQEIIRQLELVNQERESLLATMKPGVNSNQLKRTAAPFSNNKELTVLWDQLVSLAEKCQEQNRANGSIVELASRQSRHALDILRGISPGCELYDYTGHAHQPAESHSLTKA